MNEEERCRHILTTLASLKKLQCKLQTTIQHAAELFGGPDDEEGDSEAMNLCQSIGHDLAASWDNHATHQVSRMCSVLAQNMTVMSGQQIAAVLFEFL
jgi:hypothetical protein